MLTSSYYLLGGFLAASCTIGALLQPPNATDSHSPQLRFGEHTNTTVDVSYRGSGRLDDHPIPEKRYYSTLPEGKSFIAHRGSGRVRPTAL